MLVLRPPRPALAPALALLLAACGARSPLDSAGSSSAQQGDAQSALLFGGSVATPEGGGMDLDDTWMWTSSHTWTQLHPKASPSARSGAMAATLGRDTVLFGGDGTTPETWIWNGTTWTQRMPSEPPPPLTTSVFAPLGQGLVLFGGYSFGVLYHDVWTWDGTSWAHPEPKPVPPAREAPAGAVLDGSLVIFGGEDVDFQPIGDTWVFDGMGWTQVTPTHSPSPRRGAVAAALDGNIVMFGGNTVPHGGWLSVDETSIWDGHDWSQAHPAQSPPPRSFAGMATAGSEIVLFGGTNFGGSNVDLSGTWTWDGSTWTEHTGPGPVSRSSPAMAAR